MGTRATDGRGNVAFAVKPARAEQFQLRHPQDSYTTGSTSQTLTSKVAWRVTARLATAKVAPKAVDSLTAAVSPAAQGATVTLQRKTSNGWTNVATHRLNSSSATSFSVTAPATAGTYDYRVVKPASSVYLAGTSATAVLTVS